MALELYANFENTGNGSLFYRLTSATPYSVYISLSDAVTPDINYLDPTYLASNSLSAFYTLNDLSATKYTSVPATVFLSAQTAPLCSIQMYLSSTAVSATYQRWNLSAQFVPFYPQATFVAYPSATFDDSGDQVLLTNSNFLTDSRGLSSYGEGHTEVYTLSTTYQPGISAVWVIDNKTVSELSANGSVVRVTLSSEVGTYPRIPIDLRMTTTKIWSDGSPYYFDDITGERLVYPFRATSTDTNRLSGYIDILPYPNDLGVSVTISPDRRRVFLPFNGASTSFNVVNVDDTIPATSVLSVTGVGFNSDRFRRYGWTVESDQSGWMYSDSGLATLSAYSFPLSYSSYAGIPFAILSSSPADVSITGTLSTNVIINKAPFDWDPKEISTSDIITLNVLQRPEFLIYTPNRLVLTGENVDFALLSALGEGVRSFGAVTEGSTASYDLTSYSDMAALTSLRFIYNSRGNKTLSLSATYSLSGEPVQVATRHFDDIVTSLSQYDEISDSHTYITPNSKFVLPHPTIPTVAANEIGTDDIINSAIEKIYDNVEYLLGRSQSYKLSAWEYFGWLGPDLSPVDPTAEEIAAAPIQYTWRDLECPGEYYLTWEFVECASTAVDKSQWSYHECSIGESDPFCLGKYCVEWQWAQRRKSSGTTPIIWESARTGGAYAKKWAFEPCETDAPLANCETGSWRVNIPLIDAGYNPPTNCISVQRCYYTDIVATPADLLVLSYKQELNVFTNDKVPRFVSRQGRFDDTTLFAEIVATGVDSYGKVFVLDRLLSKVAVYRIIGGKLEYFNSWGGYGDSRGIGFVSPNNMFVDQNDNVWVVDNGAHVIKHFTNAGGWIKTLSDSRIGTSAVAQVVIDSQENIHVVMTQGVMMFNSAGEFVFEYGKEVFDGDIPVNATMSYNKEIVYVVFDNRVEKFFRSGEYVEPLIKNKLCVSGFVNGLRGIHQDVHRNILATYQDKVLKYVDPMRIQNYNANLGSGYWLINEVLVDKNEYVNDWVIKRAVSRMWDNIEIVRNSLSYEQTGVRTYRAPTYSKQDLVIGHNELVTNAVVNRLLKQLWVNFESLTLYFVP